MKRPDVFLIWQSIRRRILPALLCFALLTGALSGCRAAMQYAREETAEEASIRQIVEKLPYESNHVKVYQKVPTTEKRISLIFEGAADEATMMALADLVKARRVKTVFFLPGSVASDNPELAKYIADAGVTLGSYGLNGAKHMEENETSANARQLYKTQAIIVQATKTYPTYLRCNVTEYNSELLTLAYLCGLKAAVEPTVFLSHKSFRDESQALHFARKTLRGSIVSIKLGQELDASEYASNKKLNEKPADDPQPTIEDAPSEELEQATYKDVVQMTEWLLDAFAQEEMELVSLPTLMASGTQTAAPKALSDEENAVFDPTRYPRPVTEQPLGVQVGEPVPDSYFDRTVFIGDSISDKLNQYVTGMRETDPGFLGGAQFLTPRGLSVGNALWQISDESQHPTYLGKRVLVEDAVAQMDVDTVYLMLGINDIRFYDIESYLDNYHTLLQLIKQNSPNVRICIQSITPCIASRAAEPTNEQIFAYDLALSKFCAQYGYDYIDVASALRDKNGFLPDKYCLDPDTMGMHFTPEACQLWIDYLRTHAPLKTTSAVDAALLGDV